MPHLLPRTHPLAAPALLLDGVCVPRGVPGPTGAAAADEAGGMSVTLAAEALAAPIQRIAYPSDVALRASCMVARDHSAKANLHLLHDILERYTSVGDTVLDPMAGVGSLLLGAMLGRRIVCVELEPHHAANCQRNAAALPPGAAPAWVFQGTARLLPLTAGIVDAIVTSPAYGDVATRRRAHEPATARRASIPEWARNRRDASFHVDRYGATPGQLGNLKRPQYLMAMLQVYAECRRVLRVGGVLVVITCDYWRDHQRVDLAGDTRALCMTAGFRLVERWQRDRSRQLTTWQRLRQRQGLPVVLEEDVQVFRCDRP